METILKKTKKRTGKPITRYQQKQLRSAAYQVLIELSEIEIAWNKVRLCYKKLQEAKGILSMRCRAILEVDLTDDARSIKIP